MNFLYGQNSQWDENLKEIDSLIYFSHYQEAEITISLLEKKYAKQPFTPELQKFQLEIDLKKVDLEILKEHYKIALEYTIPIIENSVRHHLPEQEYKAYLYQALIYEITERKEKSFQSLQYALKIHNEAKLQHLYSTYCIRFSSFHHIFGEEELAKQYALRAVNYAKKYNHQRDLIDGYLLLTMLLKREDYESAIYYGKMAIKEFIKRNDHSAVASMYNNISRVYYSNGNLAESMRYNDSAFYYSKSNPISIQAKTPILSTRSKLFEKSEILDSSLHYFKIFKTHDSIGRNELELAEIQNIIEKYENRKNKEVIKTQNQQMIFIVSLLALIGIGALILFHYNRKVQYQNYIIKKQVDELTKSIKQKRVLLSELQHRVKNNLQHVISILELQKESVEFNNIDELIRGTQNRIHSMAYLHKKINATEYVNDVNLKLYINELAQLVKESYENDQKEIQLHINCEIHKLTIDKALPIGLIIVELVSNSMKHAFKDQEKGKIEINFIHHIKANEYSFYYSDDGCGYDFESTEFKGLGVEIIKGLIQQLDGIVKIESQEGFKFRMDFK
jgi:two-component sensor histidine kinase